MAIKAEVKNMSPKNTIIIGDGRRMQELKEVSIHLVITSPPYWQLKDYGNGSQIGFNDSYEDYINNLKFSMIPSAFGEKGSNAS
ncbi:MAG: hypothetical protein AUK29_08535 [Nitrospirae bacterium CG2_30_53_67]|nr:MAG: hypothetical protein AUK29_08535 [Nitrospirae bacterium CG2_30_53_67]